MSREWVVGCIRAFCGVRMVSMVGALFGVSFEIWDKFGDIAFV